MTMLDTTHLQLPFEEVVPGSPEDPFSAKNGAVSSDQVAASPAKPEDEGTKAAPAAEGPKSPTEQNGTATASTPESATGKPASPDAPARTLAQMLEEDEDAKKFIAGLVNAKAEEVRRAEQSVRDKQVNTLREELKAAREAAIKAEREAKLNSEDLSDEEKETLRNKYALEDEKARIDAYAEEVDGMYKALVVAKLVESHGQFGVTEEALSAFDEPDEMEAFAKDKELEAYRSGTLTAKTNQVPDRAVAASAAETETKEQVPAGASAPSDVGGGAPPAPPVQLSPEAGMDTLASNLSKLQWETVRVN